MWRAILSLATRRAPKRWRCSARGGQSFALQRTIDLIHAVADRGELDLPCGEELPVAVVPEGDEHAVILLRCLHEGREIGHDEVLLGEALGALVQELWRGEEVVGEL